MRVLIAFDKFKDALSAPHACAAAARALQARHGDWQLDLCPLADGGEGFGQILTRAAGGETLLCRVTGPRGQPVDAPLGLVGARHLPAAVRASLGLADDARVAIIEMAAASGLALLPNTERDPWQTTSLGTGELIHRAAALGVDLVLLGIGGSATHDLGLGALAVLGLEFQDAAAARIHPPVPARWPEIIRLHGRVASGVPRLKIACDVTNPLLGPQGAAAVYGPQKGLNPGDYPRLEAESARLAGLLCAYCKRPPALRDTPGAGAAGGFAFGLMTAAGAELLPGFDFISRWFDLDARIAAADIVITGEGRFDTSSLQGKGPGSIAARARQLGKPTHVFAGQISLPAAAPDGHDLRFHPVTPAGMPLRTALAQAEQLLGHAVTAAF